MRIDIHRTEQEYQWFLNKLRQDPKVSQHNKALIERFIQDAQIGKTVIGRQRKKIKKRTILKYIFSLRVYGSNIEADFDTISQAEFDEFIRKLEFDEIRKVNKATNAAGQPYKPRTKADIKIIIKKFYKWLLGDNQAYPDLVKYVDTDVQRSEIPIISQEEVELLKERASTVRNKTLIHFLFDSGARIEEALNVLKNDISFDQEQGVYKVRIRISKTYARTIMLPLCTKDLEVYLDTIKDAPDDSPLFPLQYHYVRKMLRELSQKYLKRPITPHVLRHSSATYYCQKLGRYPLNKRYGWAMSSKMPDIYIDRNGVHDTETVSAVRADKQNELAKENQELRQDLALLKEQMQGMIEQMAQDVLRKALFRLPEGEKHLNTNSDIGKSKG